MHIDQAKSPEASEKKWSVLLREDQEKWIWKEGRLVHKDALKAPIPSRSYSRLRSFIVKYVYADQNQAPNVVKSMKRVVGEMGENDWGLNFGAGKTQIHPQILNLDVFEGEHIQIVNRGEILPFADNSLRLVLSQEVLEHVRDPVCVVNEVHRVLRVGGTFYCQVPFIIGYHPDPDGYWRFKKEGLEALFDQKKWRMKNSGIALGFGSGTYRIIVEFCAVFFSVFWKKFYLPVKTFSAIIFWPFKLFDLLTPYTQQADRIAGGYYCEVEKLR